MVVRVTIAPRIRRTAPGRTLHWAVVRMAVVLAVMMAGCYAPRFPEGAPCEIDGDCPAPQRCSARVCSASAAPDASHDAMDDAAIDAGADAAPDTGVDPMDALIDTPVDVAAPVDSPLPCDLTGFDCA